MKHILLTLAAMTLMLTACGQNKKEMNTLVAYFSLRKVVLFAQVP